MIGKSAGNITGNIAEMLTGGGEMSERIRRFDWTKTTLGAIENWQQSLITAVNLILNSRFSMFVWWGEELTYIYNDAYLPTLGIRHPAALGKSAREVWAEAWDVLGPQAEAVIEKGESSWNEELLLFLERHGFPEETYHTFSYSPIIDDFGKVGGLFCAVSEDTQKVLSRRRLQTLRDLGERTLEEAQTVEEACRVACDTLNENPFDISFSLIYLLDADEKTAYLQEAVGLEPNHKAAPPRVEIGTKQDVWKFDKILKAGRGQTLPNIEKKFGRLAAGAWKDDWTREAFIVPLAKTGVQNAPAGFLICGISPRLKFDDEYRSFLELAAGHIATAIANARALEEERKRAEALAEIDRAKTEFFSNVSHEFRTPLTLMLGNLEEVLAQNGKTTAESREQIETAHRNSLRLLKLVNTLLDFSRIEAGRQQAAFAPVNLSEFTAELASNFRSALENAGLSLKIDCPPLSSPIYVDRDMWEKIVLNLLSNAFKFTFQGSIEISLSEREKEIQLKVKDSGVGIPADQLDEVFKRFHRVRQTQGRTFEGTGIGLSLVQELVHQHGGEISVESELDKGTTFTVKIPKGKNHLPPEQITEKPIESPTVKARTDVFLNEIAEVQIPDSRFQISGEKNSAIPNLKSQILLVDDNQDMREYVRRLLEGEGYLVTAVTDGQSALDFLQSEKKPDLILSDVMMPRMDGFQLLEAVRANAQTREIPVIMLSARAGEESKVEGLQAGADDYLVKPFAAREMLARVKANLEMARIRRDSARREAEILESVGDCFIALDFNYRFVYFNRCAEEYFGIKRNEVLGKTLWEAFPAAKDSIYAEKYRQALETKEIVRFEARTVVKKDGWIAVDIYPSEKGLSIYFRDITKRRQAEEKLRESEERFRNMADHAPVMIWVTEQDASCSYLSQSWYEFTGQTPETALGFGWLDAVHPKDQKSSQEIFETANRNREGFRLEYRLRRKDGSYTWAIDSAHPRFDADGRFLGYIGSVIDIGERKEAEEKLQASENQLRLVTDSIPALISYVDADFCYRFANKNYTDWFRVKPEEIVGKHISEIIGKTAFQKIRSKLELALSGERVIYEQVMPYQTAGNRYVEINLVPDKDTENGRIKGFYALIQDISERKLAEEKLRAAAELDAFQVRLSDILRELDSPVDVQEAASRFLGEYLEVNRVAYFEVQGEDYLIERDYTKGVSPIAGRFPMASFGDGLLETYRAGKTVLSFDVANDEEIPEEQKAAFYSIQSQAFIGAPLIKEGKFVGGLTVHTSSPRQWTAEEIALIKETAERTWADVERARAEKALRESQAHLNLTTEAANIGTWQWQVKTNRIFWNEIQQKMWGYEPSENSADYSEGARLVLPEDLPLVEEAIQKCLQGEENYDVEYRIKPHGKEELRWIRSTGRAFFNDAGETVSIQGISLDITSRKKSEKALRESEALLQGSIDALTKHIAVLDWQGTIINVNAAWRKFAEENSFADNNYGIGSNYVKECVPIISTGEDCDSYGLEAAEGIRAVLNEKQSYFEIEYPCHSPTEKRWFVMRVTSFGMGKNLHVVIAHENVTARKIVELEREKLLEREQELRRQAEDVNRLKDEFLATVSHELRTPLNAILGWSTMARNSRGDAKVVQRALEVVERSARNQNQIISDILEVSRIITGKLQLNLKPLQLSQTIQAAIDTLSPAIDAKAINLKFKPETKETKIIGDSDRLQQVFWNLLSNAVKFTPHNGEIEISLRCLPRFAEIIVKDNGSGIEPDFLPFVFDRFRQADGKMNRKHGGLGLGLAIVRHLVELHGGQVSVESEGLDKGAIFTVQLPLKQAQIKTDKNGSAALKNSEDINGMTENLPLKLYPLNIMVIDDEPDSLELASFILTANGAKVFTAESVDEGLRIFDSENLDLLISDIGMPERDGYELIKEVKTRMKKLKRKIPTVALTAYAREIDEKQLLQAGYEAYLPKPLEPSRLVEIVAELTSQN